MDKLKLYNKALAICGQRKLASLTEEREPRFLLDDAYEFGAVEYCLELGAPVFARSTVKLTASSTSPYHDFDNVYDLPSDYISTVEVFSDSFLDQEINRYIVSGSTLACNYGAVYLRYISNSHITDFTSWTLSFSQMVASYLALQIVKKISPSSLESVAAEFKANHDAVRSLNKETEPESRPVKPPNTLTTTLRHIYNDALQVMSLREISSNTDDSNRRVKLDVALNSSLVECVLEDTGWTFGLTSMKSQYDPTLEPAWGYRRVHEKPSDFHRISGIFSDEIMNNPIRAYKDEGSYFFLDYDVIYIQYVSSDYVHTPDLWPPYFKKLIAAKMAAEASGALVNEGANVEKSIATYEDRKNDSFSNDAMVAPPHILSSGSWTRSRGGNRYD